MRTATKIPNYTNPINKSNLFFVLFYDTYDEALVFEAQRYFVM